MAERVEPQTYTNISVWNLVSQNIYQLTQSTESMHNNQIGLSQRMHFWVLIIKWKAGPRNQIAQFLAHSLAVGMFTSDWAGLPDSESLFPLCEWLFPEDEFPCPTVPPELQGIKVLHVKLHTVKLLVKEILMHTYATTDKSTCICWNFFVWTFLLQCTAPENIYNQPTIGNRNFWGSWEIS